MEPRALPKTDTGFHIFASLAEFERDIIRERTNAGLTAARARGRNGGRPRGVDERKRKEALALKNDPTRSVREICDILGISRNTYYKYVRPDGDPPSKQGSRPKQPEPPAPMKV
jgi:DNA invertase Pin-like site-specific DNA recombinase